MKLAKIILPERSNDNQLLSGVHQSLRQMLLDKFGGYTMTKGTGGWRNGAADQVEPVYVYDVAMERADVLKLRDVARMVATDAGQHSVMIVTPNGDVEFVSPTEKYHAERA